MTAHPSQTWRDGPLDRDQVATLRRDGFLVIPGVFAAQDVAVMRRAFTRLEAAARTMGCSGIYRGSQIVLGEATDANLAGVRIERVVWCGAAEPALLTLGADPRLLGIAAQVLGGRELEQLINQAHLKLPGDEVHFPWHQDSRHRRYGTDLWTDVTGRGSWIETVTAIDRMDDTNGALRFLRGSQRHGHVEVDPITRALPDAIVAQGDAVTCVLDPGDVAIFGPYVVHGSGPNLSDRPRRAFLNGYAVRGANRRVYPGDGAGRRLTAPEP